MRAAGCDAWAWIQIERQSEGQHEARQQANHREANGSARRPRPGLGLGGAALYAKAQDKYSLKSPDGIAFSDFKGYEDWA